MRPKSEIYTPKRDDENPRPFHMGVPPPRGGQHDSVQSFVLEKLDPFRELSQMGVDIFQEALELVTVKLGQLTIA